MRKDTMTPKARMNAVLEGKPVDRLPVTVPYTFLVQDDHWNELTGLPIEKYYEWVFSDPDTYVSMHEIFREKLPFDIFQIRSTGNWEKNWEGVRCVKKDNKLYLYNEKTGQSKEAPSNPHHLSPPANETQLVYDKDDINRLVKITSAEKLMERIHYQYAKKAVERFGKDQFMLIEGILGTFYHCHFYTGLTNLYTLVYDDPNLMEYLSSKLLEKTVEYIRAYGNIGADAMYIDDAMTTNDMISVKLYEKFSMPYISQIVKEIKNHGMKTVIIYFGGVADRIEHIISTGVDALIMESSMKGFVNDIESIAQQIKGRICLYGNIDPVKIIENSCDELLYEEIKKQAEIGKKSGRFVISTGSPITPGTPLSRIQKYIEYARELG